jgi:pyridoxal phosphate enzyme (YggS family)
VSSRSTSASSAAVAAVRERIQAAASRAGRDPGSISLVAVSKGVDVAAIEAAIAAGITDIGENRVQEAARKHAELHAAVRWHMVGHVQTNKARRAAEVFDTVHSVDTVRVALALATGRPQRLAPLEALLEVELTGIAGRTGAPPAGLAALAREVSRMAGLRVAGLMTIAAPGAGPEAARPWFARLRTLRDETEQATGMALPQLSMGMSDDFDVAVEEGATIVRVGRAIFGPGMV